ncbi:hypothetical protein ACHQM5_026692 [Ranunculus cassubicifolius]
MELLVLSTLDWRMNPVTPLSFLDHIVRRLGLKNNSRSVCYLPSVLATATMLHVINQIETCNPMEYQNQLMEILKFDKDKLDECYGFILDSILGSNDRKRKYESEPSSPIGVIDASFSWFVSRRSSCT